MTPTVSILLDNLRSAYNVGSIFRTADAAGFGPIYLGGYTAVPPEPKLQKTALGALDSVPWEHHCDPYRLVLELKARGVKVWSCEPLPEAVSLYDTKLTGPTCLVFGNEVHGIGPQVLAVSDRIIQIPQYGQKNSLNVASAAAVILYEMRRQLL